MTITIYLDNFRNHQARSLEIKPGLNMIFGPNGAGKTSILEALSLLAPGSGLRKAKSAEIARHGSNFWTISARINDNEIDILYENRVKTLLWNGSKISMQELVDEIGIIWLTPQIMFNFWKDTKSRRHFIDRITSSHIPSYAYHYMYYDKVRHSRNQLLHNHSTDQNAYKALEDLLVIHGLEIMKNRNTIITKLNSTSDAQIMLHDTLNIDLPNIKEEWLTRLANSRSAEHTNIGPHKTDIRIQVDGKDGLNASTGEQNSMLISILCAAFQALEQNVKILLLDDVLAHLDNANRDKILDFIRAQDQYICLTDVFGLGIDGIELGER